MAQRNGISFFYCEYKIYSHTYRYDTVKYLARKPTVTPWRKRRHVLPLFEVFDSLHYDMIARLYRKWHDGASKFAKTTTNQRETVVSCEQVPFSQSWRIDGLFRPWGCSLTSLSHQTIIKWRNTCWLLSGEGMRLRSNPGTASSLVAHRGVWCEIPFSRNLIFKSGETSKPRVTREFECF